jgi:hypothetical protein
MGFNLAGDGACPVRPVGSAHGSRQELVCRSSGPLDQIGAVVGIVATIIVGFICYWLTLRPKRFGWQLMSMNRILRVPDDQRKKLKVVYDDSEVRLWIRPTR